MLVTLAGSIANSWGLTARASGEVAWANGAVVNDGCWHVDLGTVRLEGGVARTGGDGGLFEKIRWVGDLSNTGEDGGVLGSQILLL